MLSSAAFFLISALRKMSHYQKTNETIPKMFEKTVRKHPEKYAMIWVDGKAWTFREVDDFSNSVANYLYTIGYRKGDVIALFMESRPEYACLWLAMAKIGVTGALINFNLKEDSLAHCINVSKAKGLIFGSGMSDGRLL